MFEGVDKECGMLQMKGGVPLCCARSKTRMEPDFEPAARHSSGSLNTTDSTGDVCPVKLCSGKGG